MRLSTFAAKRGQGFGYNRVILDGRVIEESDTCQCVHCNDTIFLADNPDGEWCGNCFGEKCKDPRCRECKPFMKKIEAEEARDRQRRLLWQAADST